MEKLIMGFYLDVINASPDFRACVDAAGITVLDVWSGDGTIFEIAVKFPGEAKKLKDAVSGLAFESSCRCFYSIPHAYALIQMLNGAVMAGDLDKCKYILKECLA